MSNVLTSALVMWQVNLIAGLKALKLMILPISLSMSQGIPQRQPLPLIDFRKYTSAGLPALEL